MKFLVVVTPPSIYKDTNMIIQGRTVIRKYYLKEVYDLMYARDANIGIKE